MTKQGVVVPVPEAAVAVPPNTAPLFQYPPPRAAPGIAVRKKYLQMGAAAGAGAGARIGGGGWVESMRASSPTHARAAAALAAGVDEERYAEWMVRAPSPAAPCITYSSSFSLPSIRVFIPLFTETHALRLLPLFQVKHPSALGMFDQVVAASKGKQIVVFLDYDGTLSPIVVDPVAAYMSDTVNILLYWTCSCGGPCRSSPASCTCTWLPLNDHRSVSLRPGRCGGRCGASPSTSRRRS